MAYNLDQYDPLFLSAAQKWSIDPQLLKSVAKVEDGLDAKGQPKTSSAGAVGIMQFIPDTAKTYGVDPTNAQSSIDGAAHYISDLLNQYGSPDVALDHYSGHSAGYGKAILAAYNTVTPPGPPPQPGQTISEQEANLPPQRNLQPGAARAPDQFVLDKGAPGQPGPNVRTTATTPSAPGVPLPAATSPQPNASPSGDLPPGLADIIKPTQAPATAEPAPASGDDLPPGLSEIIKPSAKPASQPPSPPPATAAPTPTPSSAQPPPPPIYTAPAVPLIRPGGDTSGLSADAQRQIAQSQQPVPTPAGTDTSWLPWKQQWLTPENEAAFAGFSHGARQAVNPLLAFGSNVGNTIANWTGLPITTDRVANDAASETAFNAQYGNNQLAQGPALATRLALPAAMGMGTGALLRGGLALAGAPAAGEFLAGTGGSAGSGFLPALSRVASSTTGGGIQGLVAGGPYGALVGGSLGATVLPAAGAVVQWLTGRTAIGAATQALQAIYRAAARDGMSTAQLDTAIAQLGPQATLADVGGANLRGLAEGAANTPGLGMNVAWQFLRQRMAGQTERMSQAVQDATGATGSAFDNLEALSQSRAMAADPLYQNAYNNTVVSPAQAAELSRFVASPIGQRALQNGITDLQLREEVAGGRPVDLTQYGVTQNADGSYELGGGAPSLRLYNAVKRGYDMLVENARDPTTLRLNLQGNINVPGLGSISANTLNDVRQGYTAMLRRMFPDYRDALDAWAGPSADMDALSLGQRFLSTDADQTAANVARLTPAQQQMYQVGVAQKLRDVIESTTRSGTENSADAVGRIFGNTQQRNRIAAAFGGEDTPAFQNFQNIMEREATFADTNRQLLQGSPSARRIGSMLEAQNPPLSPMHVIEPALHLATGGVIPAAFGVARAAMNPLLARATAPSDLYSGALGNALFNPAFRFSGIPTPGPSIRNLLVGPAGQQAGQLLFDTNRTQRPQSPP